MNDEEFNRTALWMMLGCIVCLMMYGCEALAPAIDAQVTHNHQTSLNYSDYEKFVERN